MKNGLRLIVIVLKTAVAAYLIGCVGLSWLQQLRQKLERLGRMQPKEHRNDQTESETRRPIRVIRRYGGAPAGAFCSRCSWEIAWKYDRPHWRSNGKVPPPCSNAPPSIPRKSRNPR